MCWSLSLVDLFVYTCMSNHKFYVFLMGYESESRARCSLMHGICLHLKSQFSPGRSSLVCGTTQARTCGAWRASCSSCSPEIFFSTQGLETANRPKCLNASEPCVSVAKSFGREDEQSARRVFLVCLFFCTFKYNVAGAVSKLIVTFGAAACYER